MRACYRSTLPDGSIWCESSDPEDMRRPGPPGIKLSRWSLVTTITYSWEPYEEDEDGTERRCSCGLDNCDDDGPEVEEG